MQKLISTLVFALMLAGFLGLDKSYAADTVHKQSQTPIVFEGASVENDFPESLTFNIVAQSNAGEIVSATLFYATRDETSTTRQVVELDPASRLDLAFTWDTSDITFPPSAPIVYHWEVLDSSGNRASSEEELVFYDDVRYEWRILQDENIAVWWHDRPISFGGRVFEIAQQALKQQQEMYRADPENQMKIIVYNDFDEFAEWHSYVSEFTGGQAFPTIGVTTQIVSAYNSVESWLNDVIPHEISHLYFYQATNHPFVDPPAWLNEGMAQLNQFSRDSDAIDFAERVIAGGDLLPLWSLTGSFGFQEEDVRLAYAEALSVAVFIEERYGSDGISKLLAAYKSGLSNDEALVVGLGDTLIELQREWLAWMGVDPDMYPTPTAMATLAWPTPPIYTTPTRKPTKTATPNAVITVVAGVSPSPSPSKEATGTLAIAEITTPEPSSPAPVNQADNDSFQIEDPEQDKGGSAFCGSIVLPFMIAAFFYSRSRKAPKS
jgi:hypothetical protein